MREARRKSQGLWLVGVLSELKATLGYSKSVSKTKTKMKEQNRIEKETKKEIANVSIFKPV